MRVLSGKIGRDGLCVATAFLGATTERLGLAPPCSAFAIFDTGAELSLISRTVVAGLLPHLERQRPIKFTWGGTIKERPVVVAELSLQSHATEPRYALGPVRLAVVESIDRSAFKLILGVDAMEGGQLTVNYGQRLWAFHLPRR